MRRSLTGTCAISSQTTEWTADSVVTWEQTLGYRPLHLNTSSHSFLLGPQRLPNPTNTKKRHDRRNRIERKLQQCRSHEPKRHKNKKVSFRDSREEKAHRPTQNEDNQKNRDLFDNSLWNGKRVLGPRTCSIPTIDWNDAQPCVQSKYAVGTSLDQNQLPATTSEEKETRFLKKNHEIV